MIFGKINPVAKVLQQSTPFSGTEVTGSYMTALARPYALGANQVNFQVIYGNCTFDESGSVVNFQQIFSDNVVLSGSAISTWGEDDSVILNDLASQQGTTVTAVVSGSNNMLF
jgi:hypothetical protein